MTLVLGPRDDRKGMSKPLRRERDGIPEDLGIFLLMGQSNMSGRGRLDEVPVLSHPSVHMFREDAWVPAVEPLHTDKPEMAGVGLGMSFAIKLMETSGLNAVGLVPCAVGGTPLSRWMPGADLYVNAVAVAKRALEGGTLRGVLWHQGEHDAGRQDDSASYGDRFREMIRSLRAELGDEGLPVVAGELGDFLEKRERLKFFGVVNRQLRELEHRLPGYACASAAGLVDDGGLLHFDARSLREFGERYAKVYCGILPGRVSFGALAGVS